MLTPHRPALGFALLALLGPLAGAQHMDRSAGPSPQRPSLSLSSQAAQAPFDELDQVRGASIDLVFAPVRPMALGPAGASLFAVNSHNHSIAQFNAAGLVRSIAVPWGPVSVALSPGTGHGAKTELLVVCRGNYSLARIDLADGQVTQLIDLPAEPADLLIHPQSGNVFVSCSGDRSVVEIDLALGRILRSYPIPAMRPTFLALDGADVLVVPMLSGNNSMASRGDVLDLANPRVAVQGLRDHDLFRITPDARVLPAASATGSSLFAAGKNPVSGQLWQLGTDAKNKDPRRVGEPALRGDFISNQLAMVNLDSAAIVVPERVLDLDDVDPLFPGVQFEATRSVGQPYALDFDEEGRGYVVGLLSRNVTQLSSTGAFLREWNVGSIPRGILVDPKGAFAYVYCWGDNAVERYELGSPQPVKSRTLSVGLDPTPELEREGRKLYFDASFSMHGNASCASCHVETESDMLAWDLSDLPFDDKGPLITQTMRGIGDQFPLHWRGERKRLIDFNAAFDGLLGGSTLDTTPGGEFDQFKAYVQSLEQPANPGTHPDRVLDASFDPNGGDAIAGQALFFDDVTGSCNMCHEVPTGTNNEPQRGVSETEGLDRRAHIVVPSFNGLWRKAQPTAESVTLTSGLSAIRPTNGSGLLAAGASPSLPSFLRQFFVLTPQQELDVEAFLKQFDSGLAPAVHRAWLLNEASQQSVGAELQSYLLPQALAGNADVAVFGRADLGHGMRDLRWFWDASLALFVPEDSTLPANDLETFLGAAARGKAQLVFMGLPVGKGERVGVDQDGDDLFNRDELRLHTSPLLADTDGDGFPDGHEVKNSGAPTDATQLSIDTTLPSITNLKQVFQTTRIAKLQFQTDEPCQVSASWVSGPLSGSVASTRFEKEHTLNLSNLAYGKVYTVNVSAMDHAGNSVTRALPGAIKASAAVDSSAVVLRNLTTQVLVNSGGVLQVALTGQGRLKVGPRTAFGTKLKVNVFVNGVLSQSVSGNTSGSDGITTVTVTESGLNPGDQLRILVESLGGPVWNMPETTPFNRERTLVYDGSGL